MSEISYGIDSPADLYGKLVHDGERLTDEPHPYDLFNFFVTAAVLSEWIVKCHPTDPVVELVAEAKAARDPNKLPQETSSWIIDRDCCPNRHCDPRWHVMNVLCICWDTAIASKHYHWARTSEVRAFEVTPVVKNWYQYFFTSRQPGLFIEHAGEYYAATQVKGILLQFYSGLLRKIGELAPEDPNAG